MVDLVNGASQGVEAGNKFEAFSTNFATLSSIAGGSNTISFELNLEDAKGSDVRVSILPDSELIATDWPPAKVESHAKAWKSEGNFHVEVTGSNKGWPAPRVSIQLAALGRIDEQRRRIVELPGLAAGEKFDWSGDLNLEGLDAGALLVVVDWGTGRTSEVAWPRKHRSLLERVPTGTSGVGLMVIAVVVLWISVPVAFHRGSAR
jgi:hypothetical protein